MKKIILSISICLTMFSFSNCSNKGSQKVVDMPDANFKAYILENFDKNKDGNLSQSEADKIKDINCSNKEIKDIKGVEQFVNLESLDCSNNKIDELELRYNKKLEKLICTGNNNPLNIYIGMNSPLRNKNIQKPSNNEAPQTNNMVKPWDESKVTCDSEGVIVVLSFVD